MSEIVVDRQIHLWQYTASHSQLLLLSKEERVGKKILGIRFKGVESINIPTELYCKVIKFNPATLKDERVPFYLECDDASYIVQAAYLFLKEGERFEDFDLFSSNGWV